MHACMQYQHTLDVVVVEVGDALPEVRVLVAHACAACGSRACGCVARRGRQRHELHGVFRDDALGPRPHPLVVLKELHLTAARAEAPAVEVHR